MDHQDAAELLACLPKERTLYACCHDRYAAELLAIATERYPTVQALKQSSFGRLLDRPAIKPIIQSCGNGHLGPHAMLGYWQEPGTTYLLTAGLWGGKSGRYNKLLLITAH